MLKYNGVVWRYAGIDKASFTPTVTPGTPSGAGLTGTYYYYVVPVNTNHRDVFGRARCGLPSSISAAATPNAQKVTVSGIPATHVDAQVTGWYIFRNLNGIFYTGDSDEDNSFYLVGQIDIGTTTFDDEITDDAAMQLELLRFNRNVPPTCKAGMAYGNRLFVWGFDPYTTGMATRNAGDNSLIDISGADLPDGFKGCWFQADGYSKRYMIQSVESTTQIKLDENCGEALSGVAYSIYRERDDMLVSEFGDFCAWGPDGEAYRWRIKIPGGEEPIAGIPLGGRAYIFSIDKMFSMVGRSMEFSDIHMSPDPIFDGLGAVSKDAVCATGNAIYFLSLRGPARFTGGGAPELIGEKLGLDWLDELDAGELDKAFVETDGKRVWFAVPESDESENCRMYRWDIGTSSWWPEYYVHPRCGLRCRNVTGEDKFFYGQGKFIIETETGTRDLAPSGTRSGTVTTGGTTTLDMATAAFYTTDDGLAEAYVFVYRAGAFVGARRISSNTATQLTWLSTGAGGGNLTVNIGDTFEIGSIRWWWKTKRFMTGMQNRMSRLIVGIDAPDDASNLIKTEWINGSEDSNSQNMDAELVVQSMPIDQAANLYEAKIENRTGGSVVGLRELVVEYAGKPEPRV
jgi:hypothetical protein